MSNILILGATSDVSVATAHHLAKAGHNLILAGRNQKALASMEEDLKIRYGSEVSIEKFDALNYSSHQPFYAKLKWRPDIVICVFGHLGDHEKALTDWDECEKILDSNFKGAVSILNIVASDFESRKQGMIVGISSVAGDRGKFSNYLYGSAKAAFSAYLSGLRNRLYHFGCHVATVKPGFIDTKMTSAIKLPKPLTAKPDQVAKQIVNVISKKRNTIYTLRRWRYIMFIIRLIPESIFKRLKL